MKKFAPNKVNSTTEYELLKDCLAKKITQKTCSQILDVSVRQIKRKCKGLRTNGTLEHGNKGKSPVNKISDEVRNHLVKCCKNEFQDFGPTLVRDEYERIHHVSISVETTRQIMISNGLWNEKSKRAKRVHPMRERMSCYGEMVQADGTEYDWFDIGEKQVLLVFIDDATSSLLHAVLVKSESTNSYMLALNDYLLKHGRPMCLYTDKHGVFRVNMPSASEDAQTQFARAMESLDIKMIQANSPQAKGRVERANRTLQDRLAKRFKLMGIKTIEEANKYIEDTYIAEYNKLFAVAPASLVNVHRALDKTHDLNQILALHDTRIISKNHTIQFKNHVVQIMEETSDLYKKQAIVIMRMNEIVNVLVESKPVKFKVLKIQPKQSELVCAKMINVVTNKVRQITLENNNKLQK